MDILRRKKTLNLLIVTLVGTLLILSLLPKSFFLQFVSLKFIRAYSAHVHVLFYFFLGFWCCLYLHFRRHIFKMKMGVIKVSLLALFLVNLFGAIVECLQLFAPGRHLEWVDIQANILGSIIGVILFWVAKYKFARMQHTFIKKPFLSWDSFRVKKTRA